jgi:hypothetical protein
MAGQSNLRTMGPCDRRSDEVELAEVAKIGI